MKKNLKKYIKRFLICLFLILFFCCICHFVVSFFSIDSFINKYDIYIPLGSFDISSRRILENEEVELHTLNYTKDVDYLIKKYDFEKTESNASELIDAKEKIVSNLSLETKEKTEEYLQTIPKDCYYLFIENENGKLLLFMDKNFRTIYTIDNKVIE